MSDDVGAIADVVSFLTLPLGVVFAIWALSLRLVRGSWQTAPAALSDGTYRWMTVDGGIHSSPAPRGSAQDSTDDDLHIFYRARRPQVCYSEKIAHDERALWLVTGCLLVVSACAITVSTVAMLV